MPFSAYRQDPRFGARAPDLSNQIHQDETRQISGADGLQPMPTAPTTGASIVVTPSPGGEEESKYLWVVTPTDVPIALENSQAARTLDRGRLSHTNLTGGADAHAGGEMWFTSCDTIVINGGSSRYRPRAPHELEVVAQSFVGMGYKVGHLPYDTQVNGWARNPKKGTIAWLP